MLPSWYYRAARTAHIRKSATRTLLWTASVGLRRCAPVGQARKSPAGKPRPRIRRRFAKAGGGAMGERVTEEGTAGVLALVEHCPARPTELGAPDGKLPTGAVLSSFPQPGIFGPTGPSSISAFRNERCSDTRARPSRVDYAIENGLNVACVGRRSRRRDGKVRGY
jgi:hypothetical protein